MLFVSYFLVFLVLFGLALSQFSSEEHKRRYIGWIIMAIGVLMSGIISFNEHIALSIFMIGTSMVDFHLAHFWYIAYKESKKEKLNNREKFLRELRK